MELRLIVMELLLKFPERHQRNTTSPKLRTPPQFRNRNHNATGNTQPHLEPIRHKACGVTNQLRQITLTQRCHRENAPPLPEDQKETKMTLPRRLHSLSRARGFDSYTQMFLKKTLRSFFCAVIHHTPTPHRLLLFKSWQTRVFI